MELEVEAGPEATYGQQEVAGSQILFESFSLGKKKRIQLIGNGAG